MLPRWLGPASLGAILACAAVVPGEALAAPKGDDGGKKGKKDKDKKDKDDDEGGEADAEVSVGTGGASAAAGGSKGAPMKGRFGFGAMRSLSGLNGLWLRYYLANRFTFGFTTGVATFSHRDTDDTGEFNRVRTVGALAVGPELFFWPVQGPRDQQVHADFGAGLRVLTYLGILGLSEQERSNTLDTPVEIDVEIPAKIQLFIGRRVSINPEFGVAFRIIPGNREPDGNGDFDQNPGTGAGERLGSTNGPGLGFEIGRHAGLFMGIGVGFYFGKLPE